MDFREAVENTANNTNLNKSFNENYPSSSRAILDSGASGHFILNGSPQTDVRLQDRPLIIKQPDGNKLISEGKSQLEIYPQLSKITREAYSFKNITFPLISVAKLCDNDCIVIFVKDKAYIVHGGKIISEAPRDEVTKLWTTKLNNNNLNECKTKHDKDLIMNVTVPKEADNNIEKLMLFLYAALGRPNKTTLIKAIKQGHFATWPGLTEKRVKKYIQEDIINAKGHMHLQRQVKNRKKKEIKEPNNIKDEITHPTQEEGNNKMNLNFVKIEETGLCGTDLTGKFPTTSRRGNKYIFVLYNWDTNSIIARAMKNRTDEEFLRVHDEIIDELTIKGVKPTTQRLDNEASKAYTNNITKHGIKYQLTPAQIHRRNIAERAIQTFKNHFITILAGAHSTFPKNEWDRLLPQAELTLNLLRTSRINPNLSAEEQLNGTFNYNNTPLAPPGIKVLSYKMPSHRASWADHGEEGWYIAPARQHYQCYKVLIKRTKGIRTPPSVKFFPENTMPSNSSTDRMVAAARQLTEALNNPAPPVPYEYVGDEETMALKKLATIFTKRIEQQINKESENTPAENNTSVQREVAPVQRVVSPAQRVITPRQKMTSRQKVMLDNAMQKVNLKKRKKKIADKLMKMIQHKLSKYRSPIQKKKELPVNKGYPKRKKKVNYYEVSKRQPKNATLTRKENIASTTKQQYIEKELANRETQEEGTTYIHTSR